MPTADMFFATAPHPQDNGNLRYSTSGALLSISGMLSSICGARLQFSAI
jgi:hypothetical protein